MMHVPGLQCTVCYLDTLRTQTVCRSRPARQSRTCSALPGSCPGVLEGCRSVSSAWCPRDAGWRVSAPPWAPRSCWCSSPLSGSCWCYPHSLRKRRGDSERHSGQNRTSAHFPGRCPRPSPGSTGLQTQDNQTLASRLTPHSLNKCLEQINTECWNIRE